MDRNSAHIALVPVDGDLDVTAVPPMRELLDQLIDDGCRRIVLNMSGVGFIDSAGMGLIIREIGRMRAMGGVISLTNVTPPVMRALRLVRVVDFAPVSADAGEGEGDVPELDPSVQPLWRRVIRIDPADMHDARHKVDELLEGLSFSEDDRFDAKLAVGEAVGNAVDHTDGSCVLMAVAGYPDRVVVEVSDCGCGYEGAGGAASDDPWNERGRGIKLMRLLADSVTITKKSTGSGTVVRIVKLTRATSQTVGEVRGSADESVDASSTSDDARGAFA